MTFDMSFTGPTGNVAQQSIDVPEDYESLVMEACALLSKVGCQFHVEGFGDDNWPVDVAYDCSSVMEQLPEVLAAIRSKDSVELDFYGQGVERLVKLVPHKDTVEMRCISRTSWTPEPNVEQVTAKRLEKVFVALAVDFSRAVAKVAPDLARNDRLRNWAAGDV